jgi:hypothetical protein
MFPKIASVLGIGDHPLIASWLALVFLLTLVLGGMHVCRIFGGLLVLLIREFKRELLGIGKVFGRVKHEVTTWKVDE